MFTTNNVNLLYYSKDFHRPIIELIGSAPTPTIYLKDTEYHITFSQCPLSCHFLYYSNTYLTY